MVGMIIGITGKYASGKGEIASYLVKEKNFQHLSFSGLMEEECRKRGLPSTRENLIKIANELRQRFGGDYWAKRLFKKIDKKKSFVVESFRNPGEVQAFQRLSNFNLLLVETPQKTRFERTVKRGRTADFKTFNEFKNFEEQELKSKDSNAQQLEQCAAMADLKIINDGSIGELHKKILNLLEKISVKVRE